LLEGWRVAFALGLLLAALVLVLLDRAMRGAEAPRPASAPASSSAAERFFRDYWRRPIALQGRPPPSFSPLEATLRPEACGSCHQRQYADWKESLHSRAMGPGPWGQILQLELTHPLGAAECQSCHAPLSEQLRYLKDGSASRPNPAFDPELQLQGIVCAACHVRSHRRFGPPKSDSPEQRFPAGMPRHGGVERTPLFEAAEFCRDCHQFDPENTVLVNGKPLQDTYREWQQTVWAKGGASCQECHMPQRRHLWKGIHDPEWVRSAVRFEVRLLEEKTTGGEVRLEVTLTNAAVGHRFPTYVTPKVFVRAALLDARGRALPGTEGEGVVGWDARFENGQWKEYFDTRLDPGQAYRRTFAWTAPAAARAVRAWVEVHPDHFYHVHFYPAYLERKDLPPQTRRLIERALQESGRSSYLLFERTLRLR
jgi:hypothetical protein